MVWNVPVANENKSDGLHQTFKVSNYLYVDTVDTVVEQGYGNM